MAKLEKFVQEAIRDINTLEQMAKQFLKRWETKKDNKCVIIV